MIVMVDLQDEDHKYEGYIRAQLFNTVHVQKYCTSVNSKLKSLVECNPFEIEKAKQLSELRIIVQVSLELNTTTN